MLLPLSVLSTPVKRKGVITEEPPLSPYIVPGTCHKSKRHRDCAGTGGDNIRLDAAVDKQEQGERAENRDRQGQIMIVCTLRRRRQASGLNNKFSGYQGCSCS